MQTRAEAFVVSVVIETGKLAEIIHRPAVVAILSTLNKQQTWDLREERTKELVRALICLRGIPDAILTWPKSLARRSRPSCQHCLASSAS